MPEPPIRPERFVALDAHKQYVMCHLARFLALFFARSVAP